VTKIPPFQPEELKSIRQLFKEGKFPASTNLRTILKKCYARKFPSIRYQNEWHTTEPALRAWLWDHATQDFRDRSS